MGKDLSSTSWRRRRGRLTPVLLSIASVLTLSAPAAASASITIGQEGEPNGGCSGPRDFVIPSATYTVPGTGVITSWSHNAVGSPGQELTLKVFRRIGAFRFTALAHDGPHFLQLNRLNTFATSLPVSAGDIIGLSPGSEVVDGCEFAGTEDEFVGPFNTSLADGESADFTASGNPIYGLNVTAVFEPSNSFSFGTVSRNKKKGTATVTLNVPNAGELTVSGKGVKGSVAQTATAVNPGAAAVKIKSKGKQRKRLNATGKVKVKPKITYTPTGGDPRTQSLKVKLKKS